MPSRLEAKSDSEPRILSPNTPDTALDARERRSHVDRDEKPHAAAWRNESQIFGLHTTRLPPPRAGRVYPQQQLVCHAATNRRVLRRKRRTHPCRRGK